MQQKRCTSKLKELENKARNQECFTFLKKCMIEAWHERWTAGTIIQLTMSFFTE